MFAVYFVFVFLFLEFTYFYFLNSFQKVKLISFLFLFCFLYTFFMTVLFPKFVLLGFTSLLSPPFHGCTSAKYVLPPTAVAQSNSLHHHPKLLFIKSTNQNLVHTWGHPLHWVVTRPQPDAGHLSPAARRARRVAAVPTATPKATLRSRRRGPLRTSPGADGSGGLGNGPWMPTGMRRPPQSVPLFRSAAVRGTHGHWIVGQGPMCVGEGGQDLDRGKGNEISFIFSIFFGQNCFFCLFFLSRVFWGVPARNWFCWDTFCIFLPRPNFLSFFLSFLNFSPNKLHIFGFSMFA